MLYEYEKERIKELYLEGIEITTPDEYGQMRGRRMLWFSPDAEGIEGNFASVPVTERTFSEFGTALDLTAQEAAQNISQTNSSALETLTSPEKKVKFLEQIGYFEKVVFPRAEILKGAIRVENI